MIYKNQIGNKETEKNPESGATNTQSTFSLKKTMKKYNSKYKIPQGDKAQKRLVIVDEDSPTQESGRMIVPQIKARKRL